MGSDLGVWADDCFKLSLLVPAGRYAEDDEVFDDGIRGEVYVLINAIGWGHKKPQKKRSQKTEVRIQEQE